MFSIILLVLFPYISALSNSQYLSPLINTSVPKKVKSLPINTQLINTSMPKKFKPLSVNAPVINTSMIKKVKSLSVNTQSLLDFTSTAYFWSYEGEHSPPNWNADYPECGDGSYTEKQSPIDIKFPIGHSYWPKPDIPELQFVSSECEPDTLDLRNTGHSLYVNYPYYDQTNLLRGGQLYGTYKLVQFHFHWGADDNTGSEHFINGKQFPLEIQFAFSNVHQPNLQTAIATPSGVVMVSVLFEIGNENFELNKILESVAPDLIPSNSNKKLKKSFSFKKLFPLTASKRWISYHGSLTTPPCSETITWFIIEETMTVSSSQLIQLRRLTADIGGRAPIGPNYRPIQPLNFRHPVISFEPYYITPPPPRAIYDFLLTTTKRVTCWSEARFDCQKQGGDLASIASQKEHDAVLAACQKRGSSNYCWIGLKRDHGILGTRNGWQWVDGTGGANYTSWCCEEGIERNDDQNYGVIQDSDPGGEWHDYTRCLDLAIPGVCKIPIS